MTAYQTITDLYDQEIVPALDGVCETFNEAALLAELRDRDLIVWTRDGWTLVQDEDGNTPGFWGIVAAVDMMSKP